jgi:dTDP-glucose 4,6-dehydratase
MRILVTGGKGTVGTCLVKELINQNHEVYICDLKHSYEKNYFRCDVSKFRQLQKIFENNSFDYVYHLAAEFGRWNGEDYYENLWETNAIGTKNILRLQKQYNFKLIFSSSSEVYGDFEGKMTENVMENYEIKQMNDYAISKWVNEMQILNAETASSNQVVRVRLFNTYGPGEYYTPYRSVTCLFIYHVLHDLPYTVYVGHKRNSLYINDCTRCLANIIDNFNAGEVYNISGPGLHDIKTISDIILNYLNKDDNQVTYKVREEFATKIKQPDISKAKRDLNYLPKINIKEGIPKTIEWMKKVY